MSVKKFKFVSPGVFLAEVDNSQLPAVAEPMGPIIIGRTRFGPGMTPIKVNSFSEFVQVFGDPVPGGGGGDIWREGNTVGPTYAAYAAQAYLKANVGPVTMFRLLGETNPNAVGGTGDETAGWDTNKNQTSASSDNGGAYGLFIFNSGSDVSTLTGTLGAVFYLQEGSIALTGTMIYSASGAGVGFGTNAEEAAGALFQSSGDDCEFKVLIRDANNTQVYKSSFNFNYQSDKYIRDVLNTNPQLSNTAFVNTNNLSQGEDCYWLGESYESNLKREISTFGGNTYGMILALEASGSSTATKQDYKMTSKNHQARTGWFFGQDRGTPTSFLTTKMPKLFKVHARDGGRWVQDNLKVSITSIKASTNESNPYGSFNVEIRQLSDTDNVVRVIERFSNVNLNPNSENYVALKVGDKWTDYNYSDQITRDFGNFDNRSKYIRMEMNDDLAEGLMDPVLLPFGVMGPPRFKTMTLETGSTVPPANSFVQARDDGTDEIPRLAPTASYGPDFMVVPTGFTASVSYPRTVLRFSASEGGIGNQKDAYFGYQSTVDQVTARYDKGAADYLWPMPADLITFDTMTGVGSPTYNEYQWTFSMDDIIITGGTDNDVYYQSGSRKLDVSYTAIMTGSSAGYKALLKAGYDRFTSPFFGGFDGLNIIEAEPFRPTFMLGETAEGNYAFNSVQRAIDTIADPEYVECNLVTMPGITTNALTQRLLNVAEDRADTLAIIDLPEEFEPFTDSTDPLNERIKTDVATVIDNLEARGINSSYGCAYYPWVQVKDTIRGNILWVPPSVVVLGTFASSQAKSEVWFAPAGFNRGGLTEGSAGIPVLGVSTRVVSKDRDKLYEASINPIASFPSEGIVVFGQKTLQVTRSALDRINVRRLLIFIKKQVSRIAATILFDQNVKTTWNRFLGEVNPLLASVQSRLGLTEFKVLLDDTTTTPDLIDQNIMYAKIFLKPARAIEFIAIDFVITRTGASFED